jgi:Thioredoxin
MIEALFATQQSWATSGIDDKDKLFSIASREGSLSKDEFNRCLADRDLLDKIVADRNYAYETLKVDEAPTFFVRFGARRQCRLRCSYGLISSCVSSAGRLARRNDKRRGACAIDWNVLARLRDCGCAAKVTTAMLTR